MKDVPGVSQETENRSDRDSTAPAPGNARRHAPTSVTTLHKCPTSPTPHRPYSRSVPPTPVTGRLFSPRRRSKAYECLDIHWKDSGGPGGNEPVFRRLRHLPISKLCYNPQAGLGGNWLYWGHLAASYDTDRWEKSVCTEERNCGERQTRLSQQVLGPAPASPALGLSPASSSTREMSTMTSSLILPESPQAAVPTCSATLDLQ